MPAGSILPHHLASLPSFSGWSLEQLERLASALRRRQVGKGEVVLRHFDPLTELYIVLSGRFLVVRVSIAGREVALRQLMPGSLFGETALLDRQPRLGDVVAIAPSDVALLKEPSFRELVRELPPFASLVQLSLCSKVRALADRLHDQVALTVPQRVEAEILAMALAAGVDRNMACIAEPPTHAAMAVIVGGQREAVTRALRAMVRLGVVDPTPAGLLVPDVRALARRVSAGSGAAAVAGLRGASMAACVK